MNRLQFATLLSWAGENGLEGRKRLQKVVYLLQEAGCPLDCRYTLHYFGPYSRDVADRCDEMVAGGLVEESTSSQSGVTKYTYSLKPETRASLESMRFRDLSRFEELGKRLIKEDLWLLELGSTIGLFYSQLQDWDKAMDEACAFKKVQPEFETSKKALALAQDIKSSIAI